MRSSDRLAQIKIECSTSERWWRLLKPSYLGYFTLRILVGRKSLVWGLLALIQIVKAAEVALYHYIHMDGRRLLPCRN